MTRSNLTLFWAFLLACVMCVSREAISADRRNETSEVEKKENEIAVKWSTLRSEMLDTIKPDPVFDNTATEAMRLRKTYQMFRVSEYLKAFDVRQERELLKLKMRETDGLSDSKSDQIELRLLMLEKQAKYIAERIKRLNADENSGAGLRIYLRERQQQLDEIEKKQWKIPLNLRQELSVI
ncbi:hypothetical protein Enr13x_07210 [Stieleria neptunia]|uniref:Uncharacterized protein n=1 Tax=Stieleria neptunia TaxID=2527979 RepID=A0A518HJ62_9BACT|nr:hypothetical protein [Stieleria neptunia]QDV40885.1 hypothetical protein Enr13x_07210 [Stieleria neptunia]